MDRAQRRHKLRVAWARTEDVRQIAPNAVLSENSSGRACQNILHHGGFKCLVVFGLLDSVDKTQQLISIQETRWLRCMLGGRKAQDVPWVGWFRTAKRSAQASRCKLNLPSLWHRALAAVYRWAGHVARKDSSHPGHAAILWRNAEWWEIMKSTGVGSRDQTWRHRRRNWGAQFRARFVQDSWLELVGGCESWSQQLEKRQIQFCHQSCTMLVWTQGDLEEGIS